jgi:hypothetical protein
VLFLAKEEKGFSQRPIGEPQRSKDAKGAKEEGVSR